MADADDKELYQEMILDHYRNPRNYCKMTCHTHSAKGHNPLCGDEIRVYLKVKDGVIEDISFEGSGCAIAKASGSLMTEQLKGRTTAEALALFDQVHRMLTGKSPDTFKPEELGKLAALSGVCDFPMRVKCASLAWHTLRSAMEGQQREASTEQC
jgi:nitrogen fixation protein NifU and related proteins